MRKISIALLMALVGCQNLYYNVWEKLGYEKRDLLQSNVQKAQSQQKELQQDFKDTLERIRKEYGLQGGKLERVYDRLSHDYEEAQNQKRAIDDRIAKIDRIAQDLFSEWAAEAKTLTNDAFRRDSLAKLERSKAQYAKMRASFERLQARLTPVLNKMREHVLYLKHNLNAKALNVFKTELGTLEKEVNALIQAIENSLKESEQFSSNLQS